jgi:hypothetical protein
MAFPEYTSGYETSDGTFFKSYDEAKQHERILIFDRTYFGQTPFESTEEVVKWIDKLSETTLDAFINVCKETLSAKRSARLAQEELVLTQKAVTNDPSGVED